MVDYKVIDRLLQRLEYVIVAKRFLGVENRDGIQAGREARKGHVNFVQNS